RVLETTPDHAELAARLARRPDDSRSWKKQEGLAALPAELRLALEMTSHEDAERRWLAGELLDLERAWREAEELAAIADKLGIPEDVEARIEAMHESNRPTSNPGSPP